MGCKGEVGEPKFDSLNSKLLLRTGTYTRGKISLLVETLNGSNTVHA